MDIVTYLRPQLQGRQRDYLLMTVYVLAQHGDYARAKQIIDGMLALGERSERLLIGQAVLEFFCGNFAVCLQCLDDLDFMAQTSPTAPNPETARMRQYLRARCYYSSGRETEAQDIAATLAAKPAKPSPAKPK